jgi:serine/threonine-protein kinase
MAIMYQHVQGKAPSVCEINPRVPTALGAVVAKAMTVDKLRRYQSMDELCLELERCI